MELSMRQILVTKTLSQIHNVSPEEPITGCIKLDSHANTCMLGGNFVAVQYMGRECDVYSYSKDLDSVQNVPIATSATAWICHDTAITYILIVHEGL